MQVFLLLGGELLVVVDLDFEFAVRDDLVNFKPEEFEKFMNILVSFQHENAPSICSWMLLHQQLEHLQISESNVIHSPVNLADVYAENGDFVPVQTILKETQIHLNLKLS